LAFFFSFLSAFNCESTSVLICVFVRPSEIPMQLVDVTMPKRQIVTRTSDEEGEECTIKSRPLKGEREELQAGKTKPHRVARDEQAKQIKETRLNSSKLSVKTRRTNSRTTEHQMQFESQFVPTQHLLLIEQKFDCA
jgi:hypothetical protein